MAEKQNRSRQRQKKRSRGRQPNAVVGDYMSLINKIHQSEDAFDVEVANSLSRFYDDLHKMALGKITLSKDQLKVIDMCIKRAEKILDEHYSVESPSEEILGKQEDVAEKENTPLISLVAKQG